MKLILSRKGFDSSAGRSPSPIFPDGTMLSLPIPVKSSPVAYREIAGNAWASMGELVQQLAEIPPTHRAHLDPDLSVGSIPRMDGWRPLFGQVGAAESHLVNQGVGEGDLFLFFGLFRQVKKSACGRWGYIPGSKPVHVIFGWLQIEKRVTVTPSPPIEGWALYHPHFQEQFKQEYEGKRNVVYVAAKRLSLQGVSLGIPGAGTFKSFSQQLQLTKPGSNTSRWKLPSWFFPKNPESSLTYHNKPNRWTTLADGVELSSVGKGQEFVLNCADYPEAFGWLLDLFRQPS